MEEGRVLESDRGAYVLREKIGEGGFGITWLAAREGDGEQVVVKQLRVEKLESWKALELFEREARVLRELDHPNVVGYIDDFEIGEDEGMALVQRHVPGRTLAQVMRSGGALDERAMLRWLHQMLQVCAYLHDRSPPVIHRDISPKNIILTPGGDAVLIDFGTVQAAIRSESSISSTSAGTFGYASMEQLIGRAIPQSDLYGLGMTFIAVATGRHPEDLPFQGSRVDVRAALEDLGHDARLRLLLEEMTHPDAHSRPGSAAEVLERLAPLWRRLDLAPTSPPEPPQAPSPARPADDGEQGAAPEEKPTEITAPGDFEEETLDEAALAARLEEELATWREARARLARMPEDAPLAAPPRAAHCTDIERIALDPRGRWLALCTYQGCYVYDTRRGVTRRLVTDERSGKCPAFSPDGRRLVFGEGYEGHLYVFKLDGDEISEVETIKISGKLGELGDVAISPDLRMIAISADWGHGVYDLNTGNRLQELPLEERCDWLAFSASGDALFGRDDYGQLIRMSMDGALDTLRDAVLAVGEDGRTFALAERAEGTSTLKILRGGSPFGAVEEEVELPLTRGDFRLDRVTGLLLADHDRVLIAWGDDDERDRVQVGAYDVGSGELLGGFSSFFEREPGFHDYPDVWVGAGGEPARLYASMWSNSHLLDGDNESSVFIFDLDTREHLGNLRGLARDTALEPADPAHRSLTQALQAANPEEYGGGVEAVVPILSTVEGFFCFGALEDAVSAHPYEDPALVRARLLEGALVPEGGDARRADQVLDLRLRLTLGEDEPLMLPPAAAATRYLEVSRGLTHLAPRAFMEGMERMEEAPNFGGAAPSAGALFSHITAAFEELSRRGEDELEVIIEEMCRELEGQLRADMQAELDARNARAREEHEAALARAQQEAERVARELAARAREEAREEARARDDEERARAERARAEREAPALTQAPASEPATIARREERNTGAMIFAAVVLVLITVAGLGVFILLLF